MSFPGAVFVLLWSLGQSGGRSLLGLCLHGRLFCKESAVSRMKPNFDLVYYIN